MARKLYVAYDRVGWTETDTYVDETGWDGSPPIQREDDRATWQQQREASAIDLDAEFAYAAWDGDVFGEWVARYLLREGADEWEGRWWAQSYARVDYALGTEERRRFHPEGLSDEDIEEINTALYRLRRS
jgi:hypothetical protein